MLLALADEQRVQTHVILDERSAAFAALGCAKVLGVPSLVVVTSGTAVSELHSAVVEADMSGVGFLIVSADRPAELRDVGAPQSIDQQQIFGRSVRWFMDPGVAGEGDEPYWRSMASMAFLRCMDPMRPGPVHLNLPFREPLLGNAGALRPGRDDGAAWHGDPPQRTAEPVLTELRRVLTQRTLLVLGRSTPEPDRVCEFANERGWAIVADPLCNVDNSATIRSFHSISNAFNALGTPPECMPDLIIRTGSVMASKGLHSWLGSLGVPQIMLGMGWNDPARDAVAYSTLQKGSGLSTPTRDASAFAQSWSRLDDLVQDSLDSLIDDDPGLREVKLARWLSAYQPPGVLYVSSSMPIRAIESYGARHLRGPRLEANRGANGIDGVVSSAVGGAVAAGGLASCLLGDLALLYDLSGVLAAQALGVQLKLFVVDNSGGGIFSFLPQGQRLDPEIFERFFAAPAPVSVASALRGLQVAVEECSLSESLSQSLARSRYEAGIEALVVQCDRNLAPGSYSRLEESLTRVVSRELASW